MAQTKQLPPPYYVDDFFALRTPLLPFTDYLNWTEHLRAARLWQEGEDFSAALVEDKASLRAALRELVLRPDIREALYLASPTLEQSLEHWLREPDSERGHAAELVLMRYCHRMSHRSTPFGLFAGHAIGRTGDRTSFAMGPTSTHYRRTRLDWGYIAKLVHHFSKLHDLRATLNYHPNSSLYRAADRMRYTEHSVDERNQRHYQLVAVDNSALLQGLLERAQMGVKIADLAQPLANDEDVSLEEAEEFIHELIDSQILVPDLEPRLTGPNSVEDLAQHLARCPSTSEDGKRLLAAIDEIEKLDRAGMGNEPERYRQLGKSLEALPVPLDLSRLLQVDLFMRPRDAMLGQEVIKELEQAVMILRRIAPRSVSDPLADFRAVFQRRYEERWVPLMEALDQETGIGFPPESIQPTLDAPLLKNFTLHPASDGGTETGQRWSACEVHMLKRIQDLAGHGIHEWSLSEEDLVALESPGTLLPIADSATAFAVLEASSAEAVGQGNFRLHLRHCYGPSGARLLSRFCHGDQRLLEHTLAHLRREEAYHPEAIYAEITFLPQPRTGNVLARPVLREHEIVFLARSGAPPEKQILLSDLLVSVVNGRVILYSKRLGKEIIPRLSSAAKFDGFVGLYEFLDHLQDQDTVGALRWRWGALEQERFLPRVTCGRTILARAQWTVQISELKTILAADGAERFKLVQCWRTERQLPRFSLLVDDDNELLLDLDNILSIDAFCDLVRKGPSFTLAEYATRAENLAVQGTEGRYTHELVVPMLRVRNDNEGELARMPLPHGGQNESGLVKSLAPGSEWLFLKLYGGQGTADLILVDAVAPALADLKTRGIVDIWFFIRYEDPDPHLRVRLHGNPTSLCGEALPAIHRWLKPALENGKLWRIELGTYQRETSRYGGPLNIDRAEHLFEFDSDAALAITQYCAGDDGANYRWQLALAGIDHWLRDFGFDLNARYRFALHARNGYAKEVQNAGNTLESWLSERFRQERKQIEALLDPGYLPDPVPLREGLVALARRSKKSAPLLAEIRNLQSQGTLETTLDELAHSLIHMFVNRTLRSAQRQQELVLYDFLSRLYRSMLARMNQGEPPLF